VFVSTLSGKASARGSALYSATKFGLRGFALGLREDLRTSGVGVTTIFPGFIREAGMFAKAGAQLPKGVGTRSPDDVAAAVVRALERNPAEIDVAPFGLRAGAAFAGLAPALAARGQRMLGGDRLSADVAAGHASHPDSR
jgi:short-subunit dehydrogenase